MSEPSRSPVDLGAELRAYFALTTSTELPGSISRMSVRSLQERRSGRVAALFAGGFGLVVAAALAFVVVAHPGSQSGTSSSSSFGGIAGSAPNLASPGQGTMLAYPGVDTGKLAASGVVLRVPDAHAPVALSPAQAQTAAIQAVGGTDAHPGPAVLATVDLLGGHQPSTRLCWVVDVPVPGRHPASPGAASHTELVLVDAADGRIVATLAGHGVP